MRRPISRVLVAGMLAAGLVAAPATSAWAAPPANDDLADAEAIGGVPFATSQSTVEATTEAGEFDPCGTTVGATVWFTWTAPSTGAPDTLQADTHGSDFDTVLAVYDGAPFADDGFGNPTNLVDCNDDSGSDFQSEVVFTVGSGTTYWFQVGGFSGDVGNLTFALGAPSAGTISGTITAAVDGSPLVDICVDAYGEVLADWAFDVTVADGTYALHGLEDDRYWVEAYDCGSGDHLARWFADAEGWVDYPAPVSVNGATTTPSPVDIALAQDGSTGTGAIVGTAVEDGTSTPAVGLCVDAWGQSFGDFASDTVDATGAFRLAGLEDDDYEVSFHDCGTGRYFDEYYDNVTDPSLATPVMISGGNEVDLLEIGIAVGAAITGTVTSANTGNPLAGICVEVYASDGTTWLLDTFTDTDGQFAAGPLTTGDDTYKVTYVDCVRGRYVQEWFDDRSDAASADPILQPEGGTYTADAALFAPNTAPDAVDDAVEVYLRSGAIDLPVLDNDADPDSDPLTIVAAETTDTADGTVDVSGGTVVYTPPAGAADGQVDTFDYTVDDDFGGQDTATVTVTLVDCPDITGGIDDNGLVTGYEWVECSAIRANDVVGEIGTHFAAVGGTTGIMTSGDASQADGEPATFVSEANGNSVRGANDVSILRLDVDLPSGTTCLALDVSFMSEEYPEFVESGFNDGFLAELDASTWSVSGSTITAPDNFAFAPGGDVLSIDSVFFDAARVIEDSGTVYDGATARLRIQTPVTAGAHSVYLSIFDAGDSIYDSAALIDDLRAESDPAGSCEAGANATPIATDDEAVTLEDTPVDIDVLANDSDGDGDPLTVVSATDPANGTAALLSGVSGLQVSYTPAPNFFGTDTFDYTISDGSGATDSATVTVTVEPVNDPPVAADLDVTVDEDDSVVIQLTATDVEGDSPTFTIDTPPSSGTLGPVQPDGTVTYTPAPDVNGGDAFAYHASDADPGPQATVSITITPVNDPPTAVDDSAATDEDVAVTVDVLANDTDVDLAHEGDAFTVVSVGIPTSGTATITGGGATVDYTPDPDANGPDTFTYTMEDSGGLQSTATVTVEVAAVNDPPVALDDDVVTDEDTPYGVFLPATDADGDTLTYAIVDGPTNGTLSGDTDGDNLVTYTPNPDVNGSDAFTFQVTDGVFTSNVATIGVTVTPVNDAPTAGDVAVETGEGSPVDITLDGQDVDGDPLTYVIVTGPTNGTLSSDDGDATVTYTPNAGFGSTAPEDDTFTYKVVDPDTAESTTATVTVTVVPNEPPTADDQAVTTDEDTPVDITLTGADPEGQPLTYAIETGPTNGILTPVDGDTFTYTPDPDYHGPDGFTFTTHDGLSSSAPATVSLTVTAVNDAPEAADGEFSVAEDGSVDVVLDAGDVEGDTLAFGIVDGPAHGTLSAVAGDTVTYTPAPDYFGPDSFTFVASDGQADSNIATITIEVTPEPDAPVASDSSVSTAEDVARAITLQAADVDGDTLTHTIVTGPSHGTLSGTADGDATVTYTPAANYHGSDAFTFKVNDGSSDSNTATVSITVTPVDDPPVATGSSVSTAEDTARNITLQASDIDSTTLTYSIVVGPSKGTLSSVADGDATVRYTPAANYHGADSFTFRANDGTSNSNTATVSITVTPVNDAPVATNVAVEVAAGDSVTVTLAASDVDGDTLAYSVVTGPSSGSVGSVSGNSIVYTAPSTAGSDSFTFRANDGSTNSNTATVAVTITDPVTDTSATGTVGDDGGTVSTGGDQATADNPTITSVTSPNGGEVTIIEGGRTTGPPSGYRFFGQEVQISAPDASVADPLVLEFRIHESAVPGGARSLRVFRNGRLVPSPCVGHDVDGDGSPDPYADPDPCMLPLVRDDEEFVVTVYTSRASRWNFGELVDVPVDRLAGETRIGTAVEISASEFAGGADTVVLARADQYPDALSGAPLAAGLGAPILLTDTGSLHADVAAEIARLGAQRAVLLGGEAALSPAVVDGLAALGITGDEVTRYGGATRFDTARLVALQVGGTAVYVTEGVNPDPNRGWPDAVAVSGLAAHQQRPILLVEAGSVPAETSAALASLGADHVTIVGGPAAVSEEVQAQLGASAVTNRLWGASRYETSLAVAEASITAGLDPSETWFATGRKFPDALAAGPAVAATGGVLLLTSGETVATTPSTVAWLDDHAASMVRAVLVGGPVVLSEVFADDVAGRIAGA